MVANAGIKSIFTRVKKAITGYVNDSILDMHSENLAKHCKLQKKSLDQIGESINSIKNPLTRKEIATDSEEYTKNIQALHDIKSNDEHNFFKLKKLISLSAAIEKLDKKAHEKLKKANGLLPEDSIKESINFMKRSQITHDENQKTMLAIKKTTLAVAAITTLSIAIKGTGFFIAVATAAVSSLLSFTIKKVSGFTKENALKMEKESEDEGGKKTETDSNSKSKNVHPHN